MPEMKVNFSITFIIHDFHNSNREKCNQYKILHAAKQERRLDDGLAFRGEDSIFSNFHEAEIVIGGERFNSVEQYFNYCKAVEHGYSILARKIINKSNPRDQKYLGDRVVVKDPWENKREKVLYVGIYAKFSQNLDLGRMLLATGNRQLYEATGDLDYGCGIGLKSSKWATKDWDGTNICGNLFMKVREELVGKIDMGDTSIDDINDDATSTLPDEANTRGDTRGETAMLLEASQTSNKTIVAENTLVEIASQTIDVPASQSVSLVTDNNEYNVNYPYLEKAKSPPAQSTMDKGSLPNVGRPNHRVFKKAKQSKHVTPFPQNSKHQLKSSQPPRVNSEASAGGVSSRSNTSSAQVNEDDFIEILKKKRNQNRGHTSTPSTSLKSRQKNLEAKLNQQNKGLQKLGLEPSSDFVKNIMDNHSF